MLASGKAGSGGKDLYRLKERLGAGGGVGRLRCLPWATLVDDIKENADHDLTVIVR